MKTPLPKLIYSILMVLVALPAWAKKFEYCGLCYETVTDSTSRVIRLQGGEYSGDITVPAIAEYEGKTYAVTEIGVSAFSGCSGLTSVTLPASLTTIGYSAFYKCTSLTSVTLPSGMTTIGYYAFYGCSGLTSVTCKSETPPSANYEAFSYETSASAVLHVPSGATDAYKAAKCWMSFKLINAFYFDGLHYEAVTDSTCRVIRSQGGKYSGDITVPAMAEYEGKAYAVTSIGESAFYECSDLTSVTLPSGLTEVGDHAFWRCASLTSVTCKSETPPLANYEAFSHDTYASAVLHVPSDATDAYGAAKCWMSFKLINAFYFDGLHYEAVTDSTCRVIRSQGGKYSGDITVPAMAEYEGKAYAVTSIGERAFYDCDSLTSVTLPSGLTTIGYDAFYDCDGLTSVTLPFGLTTIGNSAFYSCSSLTNVFLPSGLTTICDNAFSGCNLMSVTFPDGLTTIGYNAFSGCNLTSVTFPDGLTTIGDYAFYYCDSLTSVTLQSGLESIGNFAFSSCFSLTSVSLPSGLTTIGINAFCDCSSITSVTCMAETPPSADNVFCGIYTSAVLHVPSGATDAYRAAECWKEFKLINAFYFDGLYYETVTDSTCQVISSQGDAYSGDITVPASAKYKGKAYAVTSIGDDAFYECSSLTSVNLPSCLTSIGGGAFYKCSGLTSMTLPSGLTEIGGAAFYECSGLTSVNLPSCLTTIGYSAFYECSGLTSVTLPDGLTTIGDNAFFGCSGLTSVTIPDGLTTVGDYAFCDCYRLTSVTCKSETPPSASWYTFDGKSYATVALHVPSGTADSYKAAECWKEFILINEHQPSVFYYDGLYYETVTDSTCQVISSQGDARSGDITIPAKAEYEGSVYAVTTIGNGAFYGCTDLMSVALPPCLTTIGDRAFYDCYGLKNVVLPSGLITIGEGAFAKCSGLRRVVLPPCLTTIGDYAFYDCYRLRSVVLPSGLTSIGVDAFYDCSGLMSVTCKSETPPSASWFTFDRESYATVVLHVPKGATDSYRAAECWSKFNLINEHQIFLFDGLYYETVTDSTCHVVRSQGDDYSGDITIPAMAEFEGKTYAVTEIGTGAFSSSTGLTSVTLSTGLTEIGDDAFRACANLTSVVLPSSLTMVGDDAFWACDAITSVTCRSATPPLASWWAFDHETYAMATLHVPSGTADAYKKAGCWKEFSKLEELKHNGMKDTPTDNAKLEVIYNLYGHRLAKPRRGVNIVNGRKVQVK